MTAPLNRLQGLLSAVQRNRRAPRGPSAAPPAPSAPAALDPEILAQEEFPLEPERGSIPISLDPRDVPPPPVEVPRAAAVPFEARSSHAYAEPAGFGTVDAEEAPYAARDPRAEDPFGAVDVDTGTDAEPPTVERPMFHDEEARFDQFPDAEGSVVTAPPVAQPSRPIAHMVSRHPPAEIPTFGKLLARSLSLRAR